MSITRSSWPGTAPRPRPRKTAFQVRAAPNCRSRAAGRLSDWENGYRSSTLRRFTRVRLSRALDTARIVAGHARGLEPVTRDGLQEIGHGHWEGMKREDVEREFGAGYAAWEEDPFNLRAGSR